MFDKLHIDWAFSAVAVLVSIWTLLQSRRASRSSSQMWNQFKDSELVLDYTRTFYADQDLAATFMQLNGETAWRPDIELLEQQPQPTEASAQERRLAWLLDFCNSICLSLHNSALSLDSVANTALGFVLVSVWQHQGVQDYIAWVDRPGALGQRRALAFKYLRRYAPAIAEAMYSPASV